MLEGLFIEWPILHIYTFFFNKNFGSAPSTKSFLILYENFAIIVLKVS